MFFNNPAGYDLYMNHSKLDVIRSWPSSGDVQKECSSILGDHRVWYIADQVEISPICQMDYGMTTIMMGQLQAWAEYENTTPNHGCGLHVQVGPVVGADNNYAKPIAPMCTTWGEG